ncbi:sulfatase family protein [Saccharicrinis sp. 156]|uniref:sulfatase family protein n=1 Tax=Saccharicrinis sp. 156 TaxID=3417574 RepID=UPI003D32BC7A
MMNNKFMTPGTQGILNCLLILLFLSCGDVLGQNRPNILWVTIEDTSPQFIGCYGNKDARTPEIDKLALKGVRFENAFSTGTVCSSSRSTIITGVHTFEMGTGHQRSAYPIPDFIKGFPYFLKQQGYYVSNNSKTDYNIANADEFTNEAWHESSSKAGWWKRQPGQPFFSVFNIADSHQSRTMTNSYEWYQKNVLERLSPEQRIAEDEFKMPPFYNDTPEMRKHFARVYNSIKLTDVRIGEILRWLEQDNLRDSTIIFFYADHGEGIPRCKANGINLGYRVPFVVWFPEMYKHLSPWGTGGVVTDELIDFKDLAPTLIHLTGGIVPEYMKGRVFIGDKVADPAKYIELSTDRVDNGIDLVRSITDGRFIYSRNYMPFMPQFRYINYFEIGDISVQMRKDYGKGYLNAMQKSIFSERPTEYLYDIENDIWETRNLVDDPEYRKILLAMRKQLEKRILGSRDVLFLPEYEMASISKNETPYEYRMDNKRFSVKKIYKAASLSGSRGDEAARRQQKLLKNSNKIVRYWAITGMRSQSAKCIKAYKDDILGLIDDEYPPVAVTAAAVASHNFDHADAKIKLAESCKSKNKDIALMAVNFLLYQDNKDDFIEVVKSVYKVPNQDNSVKSACKDFLSIVGLKTSEY